MSFDGKVFQALDEYFKKLDRAPVSLTGMFRSERDKERYETSFMYAFRKYRAARYHYSNVNGYLRADKDDARTISPLKMKGYKPSKIVIGFSRTADHYVYELSAFLEALKSAVDFLAAACSPHLPGIQLDSISPLIRVVGKGSKKGPLFDEVKRNLNWLEKLRSYRHHVVHRRVISTSSGYEKRIIEGIPKTVMHPVVVPESPPSYVPDTRAARALQGESIGLDSSWGEISVKTAGGTKTIVKHFFSYPPSAGFVAIEDFMKSHLNSFERFFVEIIKALSKLDFKKYRRQIKRQR